MNETQKFDVIIIGGSYAGLSAALSLGRLSKTVMVIDSGNPCNQTVLKSYNFLTQNGNSPKQILEMAKEQVLAYPTVSFKNDKVIDLKGTDGNFEVRTKDGYTFSAKKILFATGVRDVLPKISGYSECWGISVVHCPYCHGFEFSGKVAAIYADDEAARQLVNLLLPMHAHLTLISKNSDENFDFGSNVTIIAQAISNIHHLNGWLNSITLENGDVLDIEVLYTDPSFEQHSHLPGSIGCRMTDKNLIYISSDLETSITGIYACGDCTSLMRSIATAVASGNLAGAIINKALSKAYLMEMLSDNKPAV
ncbi:NAD(P)/FAD-dependent oxidoreductase [Pedobacter ureilyticus]|uniref:NAD(P)/FAD-dependent oxidoreductase n=1 Tax=Pedobacter ureilyticus TaxID=1393051 RepID=A0ABW9JC01_9SPHI|nr:NAD(P)/FAD-dependent oxidoreductase [Pedobacter helvus]